MQRKKLNALVTAMLLSLLLYYLHTLAVALVALKLGQNASLAVSCISVTLAFIIPALIYCRLAEVKARELFVIKSENDRTRNPSKTPLLFIFALALTVTAVNVFGMLTDVIYFALGGKGTEQTYTAFQYAILFLRNVLIAPVIEEILFRGVVLDATYGCKGYKRILLSALLFAIGHYSIQAFFYAFAAGIILAYFAIRAGSLSFVIGVHFAQNLITFVFSVFGAFIDAKLHFILSTVTLLLFLAVSVIGAVRMLKENLSGGTKRA